jgi:hypothetical protein
MMRKQLPFVYIELTRLQKLNLIEEGSQQTSARGDEAKRRQIIEILEALKAG